MITCKKKNAQERKKDRQTMDNPMRDYVTLFLVTSKRDLVVEISREFKRNIEHVLEILQNEKSTKG